MFVKQFLLLLSSVACCTAAVALDAPKVEPNRTATLSPPEAEAQGRALVADLLARKPEPVTNTGVLRVRGADRQEREIQVKFQVSDSPGGVVTVYEALGTAGKESYSKLTIVHSGRSACTYSLVENAKVDDGKNQARELCGDATMIPFARRSFARNAMPLSPPGKVLSKGNATYPAGPAEGSPVISGVRQGPAPPVSTV
jgi:hypothetical protein